MARILAWGVVTALWVGASLSAQEPFVPQSLEEAGLERIVPDRVAFEPPEEATQNQENWEPYTGVLGTSAFLIQANKYATPADLGDPKQSFGLVIQPVDGSEPDRGECFYSDDGKPFPGPINHSRQNGNSGRVAGDPRPGATNLITAGETSLHEIPAFGSDGRFNRGFVYPETCRFATVQTFSVDPLTRARTPLSKAFDAILGRFDEGEAPVQATRFGADIAGLSDGNFAVVAEDRTNRFFPDWHAAVAIVVRPDGSIVKDSFMVAPGHIWSNVTSFQGGFCARVIGTLHFLRNDGEVLGSVSQNSPELLYPATGLPVLFDTDRGDNTRIAGHINSPYVFLAGGVQAYDPDGNELPNLSDIWLAAYDSRDQTFVAATNVNELSEENGGEPGDPDFRTITDRVHLSVDALNRVCVVWEAHVPEENPATQTLARVLAFDPEEGTFEALTPTFFPFANFVREAGAPPIRTYRPNVSMTTREICVAAKGEINLDNDPSLGVDSPILTNFYTVFRHPDPQEDPGEEVGPFVRGDPNADGETNITDGIYVLNWLFLGGPEPPCLAAADPNRDGEVNITDGIYLLNFLFLGGPPPGDPYPEAGTSADPLDLALGCATPRGV